MPKKTLIVFILLGLVSLTADMVYEGARSASGAFLEHIGAPPVASSIVGAGEFIGYFLRFVSGVLASYWGSSAAFWGFVVAGYALNVMVLPLLAFTGSWWLATIIYLLERVGKGLRTPLRDVILAEVTEDVGKGKGFGLHEVMDQVGALAGPLIFAFVLANYGYSPAFLVLLVPGSLTMAFVLAAWSLYPKIRSVEVSPRKIPLRSMNRQFWLYTLSMTLQALGFVHWAIASYFLKDWGVLSDAEIALLYAVAMGVDAAAAFPVGYLYDAVKFKSLYLAPLSTLPIVLLLVSKSVPAAYLLAAFWGVSMGVAETIMRASIADIVGNERLAVAYGFFGMLYGIAWSVGGFIFTTLLEISAQLAVGYVALTQVLSLLALVALNRQPTSAALPMSKP